MSPLFVPATAPEDWRRLLADPERHWGPGRPLHALAQAWHGADGLPSEVEAVFASSEALPALEPLLALPEHRVRLSGAEESAAEDAADPVDLWMLARTAEELVSVAVEAKGEAPFGPSLARWREQAPPERRERVELLCAELGLGAPPPDTILFRLLQRTACALLEARRFHAAHAVLLVHCFDRGDAGFDDFAHLVSLFGEASEPGRLVTVGRPGVSLHFGWARGAGAPAPG